MGSMSDMSANTVTPVTSATPRYSVAHVHFFTPSEVASLFRVDPKTVTRWAKAGKIEAMRTLGGHRRYAYHEVKRLFQEECGGHWPFSEAEA